MGDAVRVDDIRSEQDLERAMHEYQRLADATDGTPEAGRRAALDAAIRAFYLRASDDLRPGRPDDRASDDIG